MQRITNRLLFWTPRTLCILFAAFISMFALDVFGQGYGFWGTALALTMHMIPTALLILALVIAWRWEWVGAVLFPGLGIWYLIMTHGRYLIISVPLFLLGALFLLNWRYRAELRAGG